MKEERKIENCKVHLDRSGIHAKFSFRGKLNAFDPEIADRTFFFLFFRENEFSKSEFGLKNSFRFLQSHPDEMVGMFFGGNGMNFSSTIENVFIFGTSVSTSKKVSPWGDRTIQIRILSFDKPTIRFAIRRRKNS